jgi:hemin uptake protein HemP
VGDDPNKLDPIVPRPAAGASRPVDPPPRTTSRALLGAARELVIEHEGREYRLRLTQQGKLILTA